MSPDLVVLSYVLTEVDQTRFTNAVLNAWQRRSRALVVVEPGTTAGYRQILDAREPLLAEGGKVLAPCPLRCPLEAGDWCHFAQRLSRSRDDMIVKSAQLGYEDQKFSYLVAVHEQLFRSAEKDRILARPELGKEAMTAKVCRRDGSMGLMTVAKRHNDSFRRARKKQRGDEI